MTRLAERVGVDARTVSAWEHGEFDPGEERLAQIAKVLNFPPEFYFGDDLEGPSPDGASFRAFTKMTASQRDIALSSGAIAFELNRWIERRFTLPATDIPDLGAGLDPEQAADSLRHYWELGEQPVKNMIHLLESRGVRVFSLAIEAAEVDAFSAWNRNQALVFLNTNKSSEHSRFDAAHELAHLALHRHGSPQGQIAEYQANSFASAFLMPRRSVLAKAPRMPSVQHLIKAKHYWGVSVAALAYRLSALRVVTEWHYRSLCIEIAKHGYRTREPEERPREQSQVLAKVFSALREDGITRANLATELSIPAEEVDSLVFGLAISGIGGKNQSRDGGKKPNLRVISSKTATG